MATLIWIDPIRFQVSAGGGGGNVYAYYDFRNSSSYSGSGTTLNDVSGNNRNMTLTNVGTFVNSPKCMTTSSTFYGNVSIPSFSPTTFTFEVLVNFTAFTANGPSLIAFRDSTGNNLLNLWISGSGRVGLVSQTYDSAGNITLVTNRWYHIVVSYTSSTSILLYINNVSQTTKPTTISNSYVSLALANYQSPWTSGISGYLAYARIYTIALTPTQIATNYNAITTDYFFNFVFTAMGTRGRTGPTIVTYSPTPAGWGGLTGGMQLWTVPATGTYRIIAAGSGTSMTYWSAYTGGRGAIVVTTVTLTAGHVIRMLVGQQGFPGTNGLYPQFGSGAGGGSFVYNNTTSTLILVAGGGGNPFNSISGTGGDAVTTTSGAAGRGASSSGGTNGSAGSNDQPWNDPNPGAGYSGNPAYTGGNSAVETAVSFLNATNPGRGCKAFDANSPSGGFGCGGSIGGGGGYSGGGGISFGASGWGGGGGSYDINGSGNAATRYTGTLPSSIPTITAPGYNPNAGFIYIEKIL